MTVPPPSSQSSTAALAAIANRHAADPAAARAAAFAVLQAGVEQQWLMTMILQGIAARGAAPSAADTAEILRSYGGQLCRRGFLPEAAAALDAALVIEPDVFSALNDAGTISFMLGDLPAARRRYEAAHVLRPDAVDPIAALAAIAARQYRATDARTLGLRALDIVPGLVTAELAVARADLAQNDAGACVARMTALLRRSDLVTQNRIAALDLRADAHDADGDAAAAFADYAARNALLESTNLQRVAAEVSERRIAQAERLGRWFAAADPQPWLQRAGSDNQRPVSGHAFLLSFPRSGTTLLEKSLAGHPQVVTMEEVDHLASAGGHWLADGTTLTQLATMNAAAAAEARSNYWAGVRSTIGSALDGRVLIDKLPLHSVSLPVIARLFPDAVILFALRDPRDVVLSCFRRRFQINSAMFELLTLAGAASYYSAVMSLALRYREILPLRFVDIRHESVVADFDTEIGIVLEALGIDWDPAVRDFSARIGGNFRTPSDVQLTRGLSDKGIGQWRRYSDALAPIAPFLAPWVSHFGYAV
jgi:tetratricopeptide (TPR) repeat protein